jgi:hypothetical protein
MTPVSMYSTILPVASQCQHHAESQLVPMVSFNQLPWLLAAVHQLSDLQAEGRDIPGLGDLRISEETSAIVRRLLSQIRYAGLATPKLSPMSGGGVGISWIVPDKEVSFKVFPRDEEILYVVTDADDKVLSDGVFALGQTTSLAATLSILATL